MFPRKFQFLMIDIVKIMFGKDIGESSFVCLSPFDFYFLRFLLVADCPQAPMRKTRRLTKRAEFHYDCRQSDSSSLLIM